MYNQQLGKSNVEDTFGEEKKQYYNSFTCFENTFELHNFVNVRSISLFSVCYQNLDAVLFLKDLLTQDSR